MLNTEQLSAECDVGQGTAGHIYRDLNGLPRAHDRIVGMRCNLQSRLCEQDISRGEYLKQ